MSSVNDKVWAAIILAVGSIVVAILTPFLQTRLDEADVRRVVRELAASESLTINVVSSLPVGTIVASLLNETQFRDSAGDKWVLANGRRVADTAYAVKTGRDTLPDLRGQFLRGIDVGATGTDPTGERAPGSIQSDQLKSHDHWISSITSARGFAKQKGAPGGSSSATVAPRDGESLTIRTGEGFVDMAASNETRPKNVAAYYYIKIE